MLLVIVETPSANYILFTSRSGKVLVIAQLHEQVHAQADLTIWQMSEQCHEQSV